MDFTLANEQENRAAQKMLEMATSTSHRCDGVLDLLNGETHVAAIMFSNYIVALTVCEGYLRRHDPSICPKGKNHMESDQAIEVDRRLHCFR